MDEKSHSTTPSSNSGWNDRNSTNRREWADNPLSFSWIEGWGEVLYDFPSPLSYTISCLVEEQGLSWVNTREVVKLYSFPKICINVCKNLNTNINRLTEDVKKLVFDQLPRKVGVIATNHFKDNFRKSGFVNGGVRPWQKAKRQMSNTNGQSGD